MLNAHGYNIKPGWKWSELDKYMLGEGVYKEGTYIDKTFLFYCHATKNEPNIRIFAHLGRTDH